MYIYISCLAIVLSSMILKAIITKKKCTFKVCVPMGNNDMFSTVALNSSTLALIGPEPLLNGFISTCSLFSFSSSN